MSKDDSDDSTDSIPWRERSERAHRILDSWLKPKDTEPDLDSYFKPPDPLKPGWVSRQTKDNLDPSLTTKTTKPADWIGQCTVPADIVAYCKETFGQDIKLVFDRPVEGLEVTGPPTEYGHIRGVNLVEPFHTTRFSTAPITRQDSGWYGWDANGTYDPTYDPEVAKKAFRKSMDDLSREMARDRQAKADAAALAPISPGNPQSSSDSDSSLDLSDDDGGDQPLVAATRTTRAANSIRPGNVAPQPPPLPPQPPPGLPDHDDLGDDPLLPPDYDANDPDEPAPQGGPGGGGDDGGDGGGDGGDDADAPPAPDGNANDNQAGIIRTGGPPPQEGTVARAIYDFLRRVCLMTADGAYQMVVTHGYDHFEALRYLSDRQDVTTTMTTIRRRCDQYPGVLVTTLSEGLIFDLGYMCEFMYRIQRPMTGAWLQTIDHDILRDYRDQRQMELGHSNSSEIGAGCPTFNANDTWSSLEELTQYLATQRGVKKVPLDYVVRPELVPKPSADDDRDQYNDLDRELVARARILTDTAYVTAAGDMTRLEATGPFVNSFKTDAQLVYAIITKWGNNNRAIASQLNDQKRTRNGRKVYYNLTRTLHGVTPTQTHVAKIEARLQRLEYTGEGRRGQNFQGYRAQFTDCFVTLESSGDPYDEGKKVRLFLRGIKHALLKTTIEVIRANPDYRSNFQAAADLLSDAVAQYSLDPENARSIKRVDTFRSLQPVGRGADDRGRGRGRGRGQRRGRGDRVTNVPPQAEVDKCIHITKTYYPPAVYDKFTPAEKHKLWQNQKRQRDRAAGGRTPPDPNSNRSRLAAMATDRDPGRDDPDRRRIRFADDDTDTDDQGNRSNPALVRQAPAVKKPRGNDDWGRNRS